MLVVRKSRIPNAGKGLFTTSPIRKGDVIVEYQGEKLTWDQCCKRNKKHPDQAPYLFFISKNNCVDAEHTPEALARYANDAEGYVQIKGKKNNSEYRVIKSKPYIVATAPIKANGEILVSYGGDYWDAMKEEATKKAKLKLKLKKELGNGKAHSKKKTGKKK